MDSHSSKGITPKMQRGFSLAEMLIVIAIISVLLGLGIAVMGGIKKDASNTVTFARIKNFYIALESFKNEFGYYPEPQGGDNYINLKDADNGIITPDFREHYALSKDNLDDKNRLIDAFGEPLVYIKTSDIISKINILYEKHNEDFTTSELDTKRIDSDMIHPYIFIYSLGADGKADLDDDSVWSTNPPKPAGKWGKLDEVFQLSGDALDKNDGEPPYGVNNDNIYINRKG